MLIIADIMKVMEEDMAVKVIMVEAEVEIGIEIEIETEIEGHHIKNLLCHLIEFILEN
jgi:hypothetical protein